MRKLTNVILRILFTIFIPLFLTACPDKGDISEDIIIQNQSELDIFVYICDTQFSETCTGELSETKTGKMVKKDESERIHRLRFKGKMYCFILSMEVVNSYPWEEIVASNNYLKRYEFDGVKELDKMKWTITYP